jgi:hypothetical protein
MSSSPQAAAPIPTVMPPPVSRLTEPAERDLASSRSVPRPTAERGDPASGPPVQRPNHRTAPPPIITPADHARSHPAPSRLRPRHVPARHVAGRRVMRAGASPDPVVHTYVWAVSHPCRVPIAGPHTPRGTSAGNIDIRVRPGRSRGPSCDQQRPCHAPRDSGPPPASHLVSR